MSLVEIKDFNAVIDNKPFFDQLVKSRLEAYEILIEMSRNNDYQNFLLKDLKDQFIGGEYKTKSEYKNTTNEYTYFMQRHSNSQLLNK